MFSRSIASSLSKFVITLFSWLGLAFAVFATAFTRVDRAPVSLPGQIAYEDYAMPVIFPGLPKLEITGIKSVDGDTNRLFLVHKPGVIYVVTNLDAPDLTVFLDLKATTYSESECGLVGLAFHPGFRTNRQFFVFYSRREVGAELNQVFQRVARFTVDPNNPNRALPESEQPMISQYDEDWWHQGGDLHFGPDGYLYVSLGDEGGEFNLFGTAQKYDQDFFSGILRLDVDGRPGNLPPHPHASVHPGTYWVPHDNPFVDPANYPPEALTGVLNPQKVRDEFFAVGFRNPYRIYFDSRTGELYANDTGQSQAEEVNLVVSGGNYGWDYFEGSNEIRTPPITGYFKPPLVQYNHDHGIAITDGIVYRGKVYPELDGAIIFADYSGWVGAFRRLEDGSVTPIQWLAWVPGGTAIGLHPRTGEILINGFYAFDGLIHVLRRAQATPGQAPPEKLSKTGLFANLATLQPTAGFIPYEITVPFWSDYAEKHRWFSLPKKTDQVVLRVDGKWDFPAGSIWLKHFDLPLGDTPTAPKRRWETRVLVRTADGAYGLSYRWDQDQLDATLVPDSGADTIVEVERQGVRRPQTWHFPSRRECLACHNPAAEYVLGFNREQLNRNIALQPAPENQLSVFNQSGVFESQLIDLNTSPHLAPLDDETWSIEGRIRSYLAVNCSHCHQPGGPTRAKWDGRLTTPLANAGILDAPAEISTGGLPYAMIIAPGSLEHSMLYRRLATLDSGHMPPLGNLELHQPAIQLLARWITEQLPERLTYSTWANRNFTDPTDPAAAPTADPDGDGEPNLVEFLRDTSPWVPNHEELLRPFVTQDGLALRYLRKANRRFRIEWSTGVGQRWRWLDNALNQPILAAEDAVVTVPLPADAPLRFYRLVLEEP
jgi:uncharacterized repeat protein (TIGR03806 family)